MMLTLQQFSQVQWLDDNGAKDIASINYTHNQASVKVDKLVSLRGGQHKQGWTFIVVLQQSRTIDGKYQSDWSFPTYYDNLPEASSAFNALCETAEIECAGYEDTKSI